MSESITRRIIPDDAAPMEANVAHADGSPLQRVPQGETFARPVRRVASEHTPNTIIEHF